MDVERMHLAFAARRTVQRVCVGGLQVRLKPGRGVPWSDQPAVTSFGSFARFALMAANTFSAVAGSEVMRTPTAL